MTGLYIHIPFCKKKCDYCDFASFANSENAIPEYLSALGMEIDAVRADGRPPAACLPVRQGRAGLPLSISTIYIGGGTPTILSIDQLAGLINICVRALIRSGPLSFANTEFTIESNPGTVDLEKLKALRDLGINRLSIGAQSFNDNELKLLGRIHNSKQIYEAFDSARKAGFENINLDLIFALPGQTLESWKRTLKKAIDLKPEHISAYNLQIEEGTPFYDRYSVYSKNKMKMNTSVQAPHAAPPQGFIPLLADNDLEYAMFKETIDLLKSNGYHHYEISNFAKPGFECRHNINYWKNGDYIGIGLSAASHIGFERFENTKDLDEYIKDSMYGRSIATSVLIATSPLPQNPKEDIIETIIMGLRLLEGIDLASFQKKYNISLLDLYSKQIGELLAEKMIAVEKGNLFATEKGFSFLNYILTRFI